MSLFSLQSTWYLNSISQQLHQRTWREPAEQLVSIFNFAMPLGSVVGALGSLQVLTRCSGKVYFVVSVSLACTTAMCIALSYAALPVIPPHPTISIVTSVLLFGPTWSFVWTTYYFFARELNCLPINSSGRRIGYGSLFIAGASGLLSGHVSSLVHEHDHCQRKTDCYAQVNLYLALIMTAGFSIQIYLPRSVARRDMHMLV